MTPDPLPDDLAAALASARGRLGRFGGVTYFAEVDSTNSTALALAHGGGPEGTAVLAGAQRAGRGRRGRSWFSPPDAGLYLSVIVRPPAATPALALLTLAAGVAVARAIRSATGLAIELKWPNDLVTGRPWRKLGGVLCESAGSGATVEAVVVGIGVNLRPSAYPPAIADRATALEAELGRDVEWTTLVVEILAALGEIVPQLWSGDRQGICDEWRRFGKAGLGGATASWTDQDARRRGLVHDIDADGALMVEAEGRATRLIAGEVIWERLSRE